ncbi:uncharacterized protein PFL1_05810 [Pseudozyma flocculosa PF-1]|uniref:Uncharacterized protein n=2 Tax=Pseudozyma flocculosa TaxID=84751 RepID=A0A5C3F3L2_9BASI|nr:uncharacterized protein PFL1_05810 [Pseudozyma flocculosa PF-1]EPQ26488.1 hypothetical protein PFL1_05810 [Pseudozyma flocculosa PF-1]SPO38526.1 uncharacterized protein PSFLO_04004 [Pseudozyma flocculosa]
MSAATMRHPFSNSFYAESEATDRSSFVEPMASGSNANKTRELARAVGRDLAGPPPSFRPPSGWSVDGRNADVVWQGDGPRGDSFHEDQFSDAESWDADHVAGSAFTPVIDDDGRSTFGHVRTSSVGSSVFAGRGAQPERKRKEAPPPLPLVPAEHLISVGKSADSPVFALVSPATEHSMYESAADHDGGPAEGDRTARSTASDHRRPIGEWQMPRSGTTSFVGKDDEGNIPSRSSSRSIASMRRVSSREAEETQGRVASHGFTDNIGGEGQSRSSAHEPNEHASSTPSRAASSLSDAEAVRRLPDGTLIPKMPPIPSADEMPRQRSTSKQRNRKDRSPMVMPEDEAEDEERKYLEEIEDPKRMSTLGPRLKKNSPAPWELTGLAEEEPLPRPSLRDALRGSSDGQDRSFGRFRSRPSVESQAAPSRHAAQTASGLGRNTTIASLEEEAHAEEEPGPHNGGASTEGGSSFLASQRARSKSVSTSAAAGVLKGLGLASSAGPASKKSKLVKAFRLGREDRSSSTDGAGPDLPHPASTSGPTAPYAHRPQPLARSIGYKKTSQDSASSLPSPTDRSAGPMAAARRPSPDLAQLIQAANGKYQDQAYSPSSSPSLGGRRPLSPRVGNGGLSLPTNRSPGYVPAGGLTASVSKDSQLTVSQLPLSTSSRSLAEADRTSAPPRPDASQQPVVSTRSGSGESSRPSTVSESSTSAGKSSGPMPASSKFPGIPDGALPLSSSASVGSGAAGLPMPGFHHGVQYKLISLEQAREQMKHSHDRLAPSPSNRDHGPHSSPNLSAGSASPMRHSPSMQSIHSAHGDEPRSRQPSEGGLSQRAIKNKKSSLFRMGKKKDKGSLHDIDGAELGSGMGGAREFSGTGQVVGLMPSLSVTGSELDEGSAANRKDVLAETPALSLRPVSSMFSGLGANFLDSSISDASDIAPHGGPSSALTAGTRGLLAPYSPALTSHSQEGSNRSSTGTSFEDASERLRTPVSASPAGSVRRPSVANISPTPHTAAVPGPEVPGSAGSQMSVKASVHSVDRMPSLDAGGSTTSSHSRFHSPATSPLTPSFNNVHHPIHTKRGGLDDHSLSTHPRSRARPDATTVNIQSIAEARPETWASQQSGSGSGESAAATASHSLGVPSGGSGTGSPKLGPVPEEVRKRAIEIEVQIKQLASELHQLRDTHLSTVSAASWASAVASAASDATMAEGTDGASAPIKSCPCCGCGCAEQRRLQSLNEVAVLKGLGVLDRGRALKPSSNMGNTGKFGGYTNR